MASITLKNVPPELHAFIKQRAEQNHRSMNQEILQCVREAATLTPRDIEAELADVQEFHRRLRAKGFWSTAEEVEELINEGRECS